MTTRLDRIEALSQDEHAFMYVTLQRQDVHALIRVARAAMDEHGPRHLEPECQICNALAPLLEEI